MGALALYHYPCPDGAFAALAAHLYHKRLRLPITFLPNAVYSPKRVEELDLGGVAVIYLLDFAGPAGFAEALAEVAPRVVVIDHHKTALEQLPAGGAGPPNLHCHLNMARSGATLAYAYFLSQLAGCAHLSLDTAPCSGRPSGPAPSADMAGAPPLPPPALQQVLEGDSQPQGAAAGARGGSVGEGEPPGGGGREGPGGRGAFLLEDEGQRRAVERLFAYIEDADIWRWALPGSREFHSGFKALGLELDASGNGRLFEELLALDADDVIAKGRESLAEDARRIAAALREAFAVRLGGGAGGACLAVRADDISHLRSKLGNELALKSQQSGLRAIGAVVYKEPAMGATPLIKVSLRSIGDEDTTTISQAFGGGGHRNASSFLIDEEEFRAWQLPGPAPTRP